MTTKPLGKPELELLAKKLREIRGTPAYPPTAEELFKATGVEGNPSELATKPNTAKVVRTSAKRPPTKDRHGPPSYYATALVFLPEDAETAIASDRMLSHALTLARTDATTVHGLSNLKATVPTSLQSSFGESLRQRARSGGDLPPAGVGMLLSRGLPLFFFHENVVSAQSAAAVAPPPVAAPVKPEAPFEVEFAHAFDELDQQSGRRNVVMLADLRRRLAQIPRPDFDKGLNELRRSKQYSLDSADGRQGRLTPEQVEAGIREAGSVLVYVARR
jgi:hypothetical protein